MNLNIKSLPEIAKAGIQVPEYDVKKMQEETAENPIWIHFGAGNIFRGYIATTHQDHDISNKDHRPGRS